MNQKQVSDLRLSVVNSSASISCAFPDFSATAPRACATRKHMSCNSGAYSIPCLVPNGTMNPMPTSLKGRDWEERTVKCQQLGLS